MNDLKVIQRDLTILEAMVAELPEYLTSDATHWTLSDMPKLTIGGCLMRARRLGLSIIQNELTPSEKERLQTAVQTIENLMTENVVQSEKKMLQEIHARMSQWSGYLRNMSSRMAADVTHYAAVVDVRVVIEEMINKLQQKPYELEPSIVKELTKFDTRLRHTWQDGPFVWEAMWQVAYPKITHWWLYGHPSAS